MWRKDLQEILTDLTDNTSCNVLLASCQLGPATAHGVGILTVIHAIYIERYTSHRAIHIPKFRSAGPWAAEGEVETYGRKEGRKARKYIR